jgi:outer membrane murein-binding lipoprotein Lpp
MKPSLSEILGGGGLNLAMGVIPHLETIPYAKGTAATVTMLMVLGAQEAENSAHLLHTENAALAALLARGGVDVAKPADASLRISALEAHNAALKTQIIALQEALEARPDGAALEQAILDHFLAFARARALHLPPL